jgi:hypothetical protein
MPPLSSRRLQAVAAIAAATLISLVAAGPAAAAAPTVASGFTISLFASAASGTSSPDDIARLDGHIFVGYQNGVGSNGETGPSGADSTVVQYNDDGSIADQWQLVGKVDGLGADPANHRVIATVNEDSNSSLYTITPSLSPSAQVTHYAYSPSPSSASGSGPLLTGGGTDSVTVMPNGTVLLAASNPQTLGSSPTTIAGGPITATFDALLTAPASPSGTGTATLIPTFLDDSTAAIEPAGGSGPLDLSDPDSNAWVPWSSPVYGGDFAQVSQGDHQVVFASDIGSPTAPYDGSDLTVLNLQEKTASGVQSAGIDDVRWADGDGGTLYVVDDNGGAGGNGAIYAISGPFFPGEAFAAVSETGTPNSSSVVSDGQTVDTLDLATGILTPFASGFAKASGEVWVQAGGGDQTGPAGPGPPGPSGASGVSVLVICIAFHAEVACFKHHLSGGVQDGLAVLSRGGVRYAAGRIEHGRLSLRATRAVSAGSYALRLGSRRRFTLRVP